MKTQSKHKAQGPGLRQLLSVGCTVEIWAPSFRVEPAPVLPRCTLAGGGQRVADTEVEFQDEPTAPPPPPGHKAGFQFPRAQLELIL